MKSVNRTSYRVRYTQAVYKSAEQSISFKSLKAAQDWIDYHSYDPPLKTWSWETLPAIDPNKWMIDIVTTKTIEQGNF